MLGTSSALAWARSGIRALLAPPVHANARLATGDHRHARRSEGAAGEAHVGASDSDLIAACSLDGRPAGERQVGREREMVRVRGAAPAVGGLEQTRIDISHRPGRRDGSEIRRSLVAAADAECLAESAQQEHADEQRGDDAEQ